MSAADRSVTVTYVGGYAANVRAHLLSYLVSEGAAHRSLDAEPWPAPVCPVCTYNAADVLAGVPWPCEATP